MAQANLEINQHLPPLMGQKNHHPGHFLANTDAKIEGSARFPEFCRTATPELLESRSSGVSLFIFLSR